MLKSITLPKNFPPPIAKSKEISQNSPRKEQITTKNKNYPTFIKYSQCCICEMRSLETELITFCNNNHKGHK